MATTKTIKANAFIGVETLQTIDADSTIQITSEQTITSDAFAGQESSQVITSDTDLTGSPVQTINSNSIVLVTQTQTINSNTTVRAPVLLFATAQVDKPIIEDLGAETEVLNPIPSAPTGLIATDAGVGDLVNLTWTSTARLFNVFRKDPGPVFTKLNSLVLEDTLVYEAGGLAVGTTVTFVVRAVNGLGQESANSSEATATPTLNKNLQRFQNPTYQVIIGGVNRSDAILGAVNLSFGSRFSNANFTLPKDPRIDEPPIGTSVTININGRLVFKGSIVTRADIIDLGGGLRISYVCNSTIIELTKTTQSSTSANLSTAFNVFTQKQDCKPEILNRANANEIVSPLGVSGAPNTFPGTVDIADLTPLAAAELVLQKVGNFRVYHNMVTGQSSAYRFGSKGFTTRSFTFGDNPSGGNIISYNVQRSNLGIVKSVTVIGAPKQLRAKQTVGNPTVGIDPSGRRRILIPVSGKNIRDIQLFGFSREKPLVVFDDDIQVTPRMLGLADPDSPLQLRISTSFSLDSFFFNKTKDSRDNANESSPDDEMRPAIKSITQFSTVRRPIGAKIFCITPDSAIISVDTVPKKWIHATRAGQVPREDIGLEGTGDVTVRILIGYAWSSGTMEVEFAVDEERPSVSVGSGEPSRTITDNQYSVVSDSVNVFDNEKDVLERMQTRAINELARLTKENISGSITIIGDETVDLRSSVSVAGEVLEISGVTHSFTNGFTTTVELTNEPFFRQIIIPPSLRVPIGREQEQTTRLFRESFLLGEKTKEKAELSGDGESPERDTREGPSHSILAGGKANPVEE